MPIVSSVEISKEISSIKFNRDDTLEVILTISEDGVLATQETHTLPAVIVSDLLDSMPPVGYTVRQAVISAIYSTLIASGAVAGEIQA